MVSDIRIVTVVNVLGFQMQIGLGILMTGVNIRLPVYAHGKARNRAV